MITANRKRWIHKSVKALMRATGSNDPEEVIRTKAKELIARARLLGWSGPPFRPLELASLLGIRHRENEQLFSAEAQLTPVSGRQLLLEFNPQRAEGRKNYSICHEVVHTFFDDCYELVHYRKSNPGKFDPEGEVEYLCQLGAAELLMPEADFVDDLADVEFSLKSVGALARRYGASREAVLRRMVRLGQRTCAAVFLTERLKPSERSDSHQAKLFDNGSPNPKMRIVYAITSEDFPVFLPTHKSVPSDSVVYQASTSSDIVSGRENWGLVGFGDWKVEACSISLPIDASDGTPSTYALIHVD